MDNIDHSSLSLQPPSAWVQRYAALIEPGGDVLDLACGAGRHARYLASLGFTVEAVDRNAEAIAALRGIPGIVARCADLEGGPWPYGGRYFAAVVVTNYLWRPLFPLLMATLDKGGILIYETFMLGHERYGKPSNPAFLLRPKELLNVVRNHLEPIAFEQGELVGAASAAGSPGEAPLPHPAVVQRLCAVRGGPLRLPDGF